MYRSFDAPPRALESVRDVKARPPSAPSRTPDAVAALSDAELVMAITRSDRGAFAEVYRRHARRVGALARRICAAEADDVVQDVFVRLWQHPERFDTDRGSLASFLSAAVHGRALDVRRSAAARRAREAGEESRRHGPEGSVEAQAVARIEAAALRALLPRLPEHECRPITLAYLHGHSYRQVAVLLQQPEGTVKTRIRSGLARLETWLVETRREPVGGTARTAPLSDTPGPARVFAATALGE